MLACKIKQIHRCQTNVDVGPNERRLQVMIKGNQLYIGWTCLNPSILELLVMALRPVMPLKTIIDQIFIEQWRARQAIMQES